jgi:hypothetical protein
LPGLKSRFGKLQMMARQRETSAAPFALWKLFVIWSETRLKRSGLS